VDIQDECAHRVADVNAAVPTIVFELKDANGNDLRSVDITMDGKPIANRLEGTAISLDPGEHSFTFSAPGYLPFEKTFVLVESVKDRRERIVLAAGSAPPAPAVPPLSPPASTPEAAPPVASGSTRRLWSWVTIGLGTALAAGGVALALVEQNKLPSAQATLNTVNFNRVPYSKRSCDPFLGYPAGMATCSAELTNATNAVNNLETGRTVGWVGVGFGGATIVTGVVLLLTGKPAHKDDARPTNALGGWQFLPSAGLHGGSMSVAARF
jgi:hypothetical protein